MSVCLSVRLSVEITKQPTLFDVERQHLSAQFVYLEWLVLKMRYIGPRSGIVPI